MPADAEEDDAFRSVRAGRLLRLSITHVEVRLYRRSRLSSDYKPGPAHFEYFVSCVWSAPPVADDEEPPPEGWWWDELPERYIVRRRWRDVVQFHEFVDKEQAVLGVKAKMPTLPESGDLSAFMMGVAASGDALALSRPKPIDGTNDKLLDINHIYVENRLRPYFAKLSRVIDELPAEKLAASPVFKRLVFDGASCKPKTPRGAAKNSNYGPGPNTMPLEERIAHAKYLRRRGDFDFHSQEPTSPGEWRRNSDGGKRSSANLAHSPLSAAASPSGLSAPTRATIKSHEANDDSEGEGAEHEEHTGGGGASPSGADARRRERLDASHYGFFAKSFSKSLGSSTREYWAAMRLKERRELGRRTMIRASSLGSFPTTERLPMLPPPGNHDLFRIQCETYQRESALRQTASMRSKQIHLQESKEKKLQSNVGEVTRRDICEGLRVIVMGAIPPEKRSVEERRFPDPEEQDVLRIYRWYRSLLEIEEDGSADGTDEATADAGARARSLEAGEPAKLTPVNWPQLLAWAQREQDFASDFRYKSMCAALNRALKLYFQHECSAKERETGAPLTLLLQWIWPSISPDGIVKMLYWICEYELGKIQKATPPVIEAQDRRQLESIFAAMDTENHGFITADDLAGGKIQDIEAKLRNIVDADTVRAVVGNADIYPIEFLELMCQDGYRAHEDAMSILQEDGTRLVYNCRKALGFKGWILHEQDISPWEVQHRRLIDSLEAEVLRWKRIASGSKKHPRGNRAVPVQLPPEHTVDVGASGAEVTLVAALG